MEPNDARTLLVVIYIFALLGSITTLTIQELRLKMYMASSLEHKTHIDITFKDPAHDLDSISKISQFSCVWIV